MKCQNCGCQDAKIKFVPRRGDGEEAARFLGAIGFAVCTMGLGMLVWDGNLNARWGNKIVCHSCGYERWTKDSQRWNE